MRGTCRARDVAPDGAQTVNVDLDADWLATLAATTATTYRAAVARFAGWLGCAPGDVPRVLFDAGRGDAARLARRYRAALLAERLAPATINVRLAALRSLVAVGRAIGLIEWGLEVPAVRAVTYRDTRGPGLAGARAMLAATAASRGIARQCRDSLLIRLLVDLGLRRAEVAGLAPGDIEYDAAGAACALHVVGKGYRQRLRIALPAETSGALARWLQLRGAEPGPLLRLTPRGIAKAVARIGGRAGVRATPHALRRVSITAALDATGGDVRRVRAHSRTRERRHRDALRRRPGRGVGVTPRGSAAVTVHQRDRALLQQDRADIGSRRRLEVRGWTATFSGRAITTASSWATH